MRKVLVSPPSPLSERRSLRQSPRKGSFQGSSSLDSHFKGSHLLPYEVSAPADGSLCRRRVQAQRGSVAGATGLLQPRGPGGRCARSATRPSGGVLPRQSGWPPGELVPTRFLPPEAPGHHCASGQGQARAPHSRSEVTDIAVSALPPEPWGSPAQLGMREPARAGRQREAEVSGPGVGQHPVKGAETPTNSCSCLTGAQVGGLVLPLVPGPHRVHGRLA